MREALAIGSVFAGYRIDGTIGQGGMGLVYRAEDVRLGRTVALKVLSPGRAADESFRERFIRESRTLASIEHPNIVEVFRADEVDGLLFLAMRYIDGYDLGRLIKREGTLELERIVHLIGQVASALDEAHKTDLVHRDVKPGNILIRPGRGGRGPEQAFLSDFGLTKLISSESGLTTVGQFLGTPAYVAPEQIQGLNVDGRADQYALACVVVECLTGRPPYAEAGDAAVLMAHLMSPAPSLADQRPDLPPTIDQVVARAMAKARDQRFETCSAFIGALADAASTRPAAAKAEPTVVITPESVEAQPTHPGEAPPTIVVRPAAPASATPSVEAADSRPTAAVPPAASPAPPVAPAAVPPRQPSPGPPERPPTTEPVPEQDADDQAARPPRSRVLVGAAVLVVAALMAGGGLILLTGDGQPNPSPTPAPGDAGRATPDPETTLSVTFLPTVNPGGGFPSDVDRQLLERVPPNLRVSCGPSERREEETGPAQLQVMEGARSVVECRPSGELRHPSDPSLVRYFEFERTDQLNASFDVLLAAAREDDTIHGVARNCTSGSYRGGHGGYAFIGDHTVGRLMCYRDRQGRAVLAWSVDGLRVLAIAWRDDGQHVRHFQWWDDPNRSGPLG